jgi:hypothetical protein
MKAGAFLVMAILVVSMISPLSIHVTASSDDNSHIFTLDICNASGNALSVIGSMPVIHECPCKLCMLEFAGFYRIPESLFTPFFIPFQQDRPPRA